MQSPEVIYIPPTKDNILYDVNLNNNHKLMINIIRGEKFRTEFSHLGEMRSIQHNQNKVLVAHCNTW